MSILERTISKRVSIKQKTSQGTNLNSNEKPSFKDKLKFFEQKSNN